MNKLFLLLLLPLTFVSADTNSTKSSDANKSKVTIQKETNSTKAKRVQKQIEEQMKKEQKYAKEMIFYQGSNYNLKVHEVDPNALPDVPLIEPDYDFEIDDVYRDDL